MLGDGGASPVLNRPIRRLLRPRRRRDGAAPPRHLAAPRAVAPRAATTGPSCRARRPPARDGEDGRALRGRNDPGGPARGAVANGRDARRPLPRVAPLAAALAAARDAARA